MADRAEQEYEPFFQLVERMLELIVCAGAQDRFKAMAIRKSDGVEAAIEFLKGCSITHEGCVSEAGHAYGDLVDDVLPDIKMLIELLCSADDGTTDETVRRAGENLHKLVRKAEELVEALERRRGSGRETPAPNAEMLDRDYIHHVHDSVGKAMRILEDGAIDTALDNLDTESSRELTRIRTLADTLADSLEKFVVNGGPDGWSWSCGAGEATRLGRPTTSLNS